MPQARPKDRTYRLAGLPGPCLVKGCFEGRDGVKSFCRRHRNRVEYAGHPTITPPGVKYRRRIIRLVRRALDRLNLPQALLDYLDRLRRYLRRHGHSQTGKFHWLEYMRVMGETDVLDIFAAFVAFEIHEQHRDVDAFRTLPTEWLGGVRYRVYRSRQLRAWVTSILPRGELGTNQAQRHQHARAIEFLIMVGGIRPDRYASALAVKIGDIIRRQLGEEVATEAARVSERAVAAYRRRHGAYGRNADGTIDIYRADADDEDAA